MLVKLDHFPRDRGENNRIFEVPPPSQDHQDHQAGYSHLGISKWVKPKNKALGQFWWIPTIKEWVFPGGWPSGYQGLHVERLAQQQLTALSMTFLARTSKNGTGPEKMGSPTSTQSKTHIFATCFKSTAKETWQKNPKESKGDVSLTCWSTLDLPAGAFTSNLLRTPESFKDLRNEAVQRLHFGEKKTSSSKKSPIGPTERRVSNSSSNLLRGPLVRSHSIFDGLQVVNYISHTKDGSEASSFLVNITWTYIENYIRNFFPTPDISNWFKM